MSDLQNLSRVTTQTSCFTQILRICHNAGHNRLTQNQYQNWHHRLWHTDSKSTMKKAQIKLSFDNDTIIILGKIISFSTTSNTLYYWPITPKPIITYLQKLLSPQPKSYSKSLVQKARGALSLITIALWLSICI